MRNHSKEAWIEPNDFKPVKIVEVELDQPLPRITALDKNGEQIYQSALVLTRLHKFPLGFIEIDFEKEEISSIQLANELWSRLEENINRHLLQDGLPLGQQLTHKGLMFSEQPDCMKKRIEMLRDSPMISIIVATRDRFESLSNALESLYALDYPSFEIILVDNAPLTNDTHTYYIQNQARFLRNNISLRYVKENIPGLAMAHNRGLQMVKGTIVAFTDDDVCVDRHWLAELACGFKAAKNVGCVTGLVVPLELETPAQVLFEEFGGFTKGFDQQVFDLDENRPESPLFPYAAGRFGTGANMAFRTDLLQKAGGFDPALGTGTPAKGADDMAAFFHAIVQGSQLVYKPSAVVFHQHRRTYEGLRKQMFGYGAGLTAFLTKCMIDYPKLLLDMLTKIPAGVEYVLDPHSAKNLHKTSHYPRELEKIERKGMLYGPIAYLISRWRYRKARKSMFITPWNKESSLSQPYRVSGWREEYQKNKRTKEL